MAFIIIVISLGIIGIILLIAGLRGRRLDEHPVCRRCGFDLYGIDLKAQEICPECGRALQSGKAIRHGNRRRRPGIITFGAMAAGMGLLLGGLVAYVAISGTDTIRYLPDRWVVRQAFAEDAGERIRARTELIRRISSDELNAAAIDDLVQNLIELQQAIAESEAPQELFNARWGGLVKVGDALLLSGRLQAGQVQALQQRDNIFRLKIYPVLAPNDPLPFEVMMISTISSDHGGTQWTMDIGYAFGPILIDGEVVAEDLELGQSFSSMNQGIVRTLSPSNSAALQVKAPTAPGEHSFELHISTTRGPEQDIVLRQNFEVQEGWELPTVRNDELIQAFIEMYEVSLVPSPPSMPGTLHLQYLPKNPAKPVNLAAVPGVKPCWLGAQVWLETPTQRFELGEKLWGQAIGGESHMVRSGPMCGKIEAEGVDQVTIVFEPDAQIILRNLLPRALVGEPVRVEVDWPYTTNSANEPEAGSGDGSKSNQTDK